MFVYVIPMVYIPEENGFIGGHPGTYALVITLLTAVTLVLGIHRIIVNSIIGNLLELIGKYSYSIYLVHFPIIVLALYQPFTGTIFNIDESLIYFILL